jgi:translation initiation factor IF-3
MAHREIGFSIFQQLADDFQDVAKLEVPPRVMGRRMTMIVAPASKPKGGKQTKESEQAEQTPPPRIDRSVRQSAAQQAAAQRVARQQDDSEQETE